VNDAQPVSQRKRENTLASNAKLASESV